jgi:hypothetical protein
MADFAYCIQDDSDSEDTEAKPQLKVDPWEELLRKSAGTPIPASKWTVTDKRLRELGDVDDYENVPSERVVGGVYWVRAPGGQDADAWAATQPWFELLNCTPKQNGLAPVKPKSFPIWYSHPDKDDWIGLPRFHGLSLFGPPTKDIRSDGKAMNSTVALDTKRPLRDYQLKAKQAALDMLGSWGGATIIADCGAGA